MTGELPYVHGAGEPEPGGTLLSPVARGVIDGWLAGVRAVKDGTCDMFFIEHNDHSGQIVKPDNASEVEKGIIDHFGLYYPEIVPQLESE